MRILIVSFLFVTSLILSKRVNNHYDQVTPKIDSILLKLEQKKKAVDNYTVKHGESLIVFVKMPGKKNLIKIINENWPDEIEYTYNILKNQSGKIIFIAQIPYSESGDWWIEYKHYFDDEGNTYAFNKEESIFGDNVKGGVIREILLNYYDPKFNNINHVSYLTDKDHRVIKANKDLYDFRNFKYSIYKTLNDCLKAYNIPLPIK